MGKKVLIIRSTVVTKDSQLQRDAKTLAESIVHAGFVMLPANYTYEFGEIDGVVWDKQEKEEKKLSVESVIDIIESTKFPEPVTSSFAEGYNTALRNVRQILLDNHGNKENLNENLRDSEN